MPIPPPPEVAGVSLSGTTKYVITEEENRSLCRSVDVEPRPDGTAHPIYYYIATQVAMGKTVAGLCAACDFDVEDGPMMGTSKVSFFHPIKTEEPYTVTGEILSLVRKNSRKLGVMDLLEYQLHLNAPDGTRVLTTTNSWVLPRKEVA